MSNTEKSLRLNKYKNILHSRHFRSSFSILTGLLCLVFIIGSFLSVSRTLAGLRRQLEETAEQAALGIRDFLAGMEESAVFIGNLPSVNTIMGLPHPSIDNLAQMIDDVTPYSSVYSYESICVYLNHSQRIFDTSGGMYYFSDFYNQELLEKLLSCESKEMWLFPVLYQRYYGPDPAVPVIMYVRRLPLYSTSTQGYISVAYSLERLHRIVEDQISPSGYTACITFRDQLLWSNSQKALEQWKPSLSASENEAVLFPDAKPYSSSQTAQCTFYLTGSELLQAVLPPLFKWILGCLGAAAGICIVSGIYSALMLQHVDAMMRKMGIIPYTEGLSNDRDEFLRINAALDGMNAKMSDIDGLMQKNRQLIRERLLTGILYNYVDWKKLPSEYEEHGIVFPHDFLAVILIFLPSLKEEADYTRREQLQLLVRTNATNAISALGTAYSLYMEHDSICILLNTGLHASLQEELSGICRLLKENMKKNLSLYPQFSIGICSETEPRPWKAYQLARRNFIFTAADSDDFVLFGWQNEFTSAVDPDLLSLMSQAVIDRDQARLKELADVFRDRYLGRAGADVSDSRRLCVTALCTIYSTLLDMSGDMPDSPLHSFLRRLEASSCVEDCEKNFHSALFGLLNAKSRLSTESHSYIQKAVQYLEQHYQEPVTIPQIADHVGLSSVYLTKLFKLATGKTLSEYLNYYRNQQSLWLLTQTGDTVNEISAKVGYTDVRSYIRFFKKFYHVTPGEYRREHGGSV